MNAFRDIWIGNTNPVGKRPGNKDWASKGSVWHSDAGDDMLWKQELHTASYTMIVLGQFYEQVSMPGLLNDCVNYATGLSTRFNDPAGHYIIFLVDKEQGNKYVFTNRFGTYHAYWSTDRDVKAISTYYIGLAKQVPDKNLDWEGISGFMAMGYFPEDKTYLNNIHIFTPSSCYSFDKTGDLISKKLYWNWSIDNSSIANIKETLKDTLIASIEYAVSNYRVAMPVSGGLDSRMLAGTLSGISNAGYKSAWAFSYGYTDDSAEIRIGEKISKAAGLSFRKKVVPNYLFEKIDEIVGSVELFQYVDGTRQACMLDELGNDADVVIGGHWGDVWMDDAHLGEGTSTKDMGAFFERKIIKKGSGWLLNKACAPHLSNATDYLKDYFNTYTGKYKHLGDVDKIIKAYKTDQWSFRWTMASVRMYQYGAFPVLPFYDKRVVELLLSVPGSEMKDRKFQVEYIKQFMPSLAAITWQEYDANLYNYKYINNRNYLYRIFNKANRLIKGEPVSRNWEVFYLNANGKKNLEAILYSPQLTGIVPQKDIAHLVADFYRAPTAATGYSISMLHTFARFLKEIDEPV